MAQARIDGVEDNGLVGVRARAHLFGEGSDREDFKEFGGLVSIFHVLLIVLLQGFEDGIFVALGHLGLHIRTRQPLHLQKLNVKAILT